MLNRNIRIEQDDFGKFVLYGNVSGSVTKCIKTYMTYGDKVVEHFIPVYVKRYGNVNYDYITTLHELEERTDFQGYLNDIYENVYPDRMPDRQ